MAYSSIAQSGFLLVGVGAFIPTGMDFMLFYATVYLLTNFLVFIYLQYFDTMGFESMESFAGVGKKFVWPDDLTLIGTYYIDWLTSYSRFHLEIFYFFFRLGILPAIGKVNFTVAAGVWPVKYRCFPILLLHNPFLRLYKRR